jgi:hypothetical protein
MGLHLSTSEEIFQEPPTQISGQLLETPQPKSKLSRGITTSTFRTNKNIDYSLRDARNKKLGILGELIVLEYEKQKLLNQGREDLANKVRHVSQIEGDGAGYPIRKEKMPMLL